MLRGHHALGEKSPHGLPTLGRGEEGPGKTLGPGDDVEVTVEERVAGLDFPGEADALEEGVRRRLSRDLEGAGRAAGHAHTDLRQLSLRRGAVVPCEGDTLVGDRARPALPEPGVGLA